MFGTTRPIHHRSFAITASTAATLAFASLGTQKQARCYGHANPTNNRLKDKTVLITGATAGIGRACVLKFAEQETRLVLVGRRKDKLEEVKKAALTVNPALKILTVPMSVSDTEEVAKLPEKLPAEFRDVSILVNNAGLALGVAGADTNNVKDAQTVMDTNVMGVIAFCSAFLPGMKKRGEGQVINMGSVAGHYAYSSGSVYNASKYAVRGFTEAARHDLAGTPIRMTHISPGLVGETEFSDVRFGGTNTEGKRKMYDKIVALHPDDVADCVVFSAQAPPHVQIGEMMVYATNQSGPRDIARVGPSLGKSAGN